MLLQRGPALPKEDVRPDPQRNERNEGDRVLACASCLGAVTTSAARIEVGGRHEHSFVNPHGLRFRIGCFAAASAVPVGEASAYWTWFPGFQWQIELCAACGGHLGWRFLSADSTFHGLILDRLVEVDSTP
jgi:hypothetical protein